MLIRSQDRKQIFYVGAMKNIIISPYEEPLDALFEHDEKRYVLFDGRSSIGGYQTEQRAVEVLDEICNAYQYTKVGEATGLYGSSEPQYVYQMPEE